MKKLKKISIVMILMTMVVGAFSSDLLLADDMLEPETSEVSETPDSEEAESVEDIKPTETTEETTKESETQTTEKEIQPASEEVTVLAAGFVENDSPNASDVPTYYESKEITTGDGTILYSFKGRNNNTYYRVYGSQDGAADAFYETNSQGIITSTTPVDTTTEKTTIAPYLFEGEIFSSVPTTITKEDTITTTAGYDVYSFDGADGNKIYVAYGYISNVSDPDSTKGWYELDEDKEYKVKDFIDGKQDDINKYVLNKSNTGFAETAAPSTIPDYYNTPVKMESDTNTLVTRERVYAFTGKDGVTYYRVYGTVNGTDEGFYESDQYGNIKAPANKIILSDEEKNLKPTDSKPGGEMGTDEAYVSSISVNTVRDGTSVWDSDDTPGNDSSNNNGIVRTFDKIGYTIDANIQVRTTSGYTSFTSGYAYFRVTLPYTSDVAEFSLDDMKWIVDAKVEVINGKQVLTGKRYFSAAVGETVFPGTRQFPFEIKVNGAKNGDIIKPIFEVWMDGNPESDYKSVIGDDVKVSAAPNYNIELARNTSMSWKDDFDFSTGNSDAMNNGAGVVTGRLYGYGVNIEIRNYNAAKGLKGIELPKGKITFELEVTAYKNSTDVTGTGTGEIMPLLWDYKANSSAQTGSQGRNMYFNGNSFGHQAYKVAPHNTGSAFNSAVNGGTWNAEQTNEIITVEVDAYSFLTSSGKYHWPTHASGTSNSEASIKYGEDKGRGVFSAGYFQILFPFEDDIGTGGDYNLVVSDKNFKATSISDTETTTQVITTDDSRNVDVVLLPPGSYNKNNYFAAESKTSPWGIGNNLSTGYSYSADGWAAKGQTLRIFGGVVAGSRMDGEQYPYAVNIFQKFDTTAFQPLDDAGENDYVVNKSVTMQFKLRYGAKADGSGWLGDTDMNLGKEEDLIYFTSMADLKAALGDDAVCVAVLIEGRNGIIPIDRTEVGFKVKMLDTANSGEVYQTVNNLKIWTQKTGSEMTFEDSMLYYGQAGHETSTDYMDNPDVFINGTVTGSHGLYQKSQYDSDGNTLTGSHTPNGYQSGASVLIVGNKATITKAVAQQSGGKAKDVFDLDASEREVDYVLSPSLQLANGEAPDSEMLDNVRVIDTLPYGVTYVEGSTVIGGTYNQTTQSVDDGDYSTGVQPVVGTTTDSNGNTVQTLTWEFTDVKVGDAMDKIYYSVIIGNAADPENDVDHNDSFTNTVNIYADGDGRAINLGNGNTYSAGFTVTKTNATTFAKGIDQNMYELGEDVGYFLTYTNTSQSTQSNVRLLDVLPYSGDWRGTKFDGSYTVESITLTYSDTPSSTMDLAYSTDASMKNQNNTAYNVNTSSFTTATKSVSGTTVTYTIPSSTTPTAIYLTGNLDGQTTIKISYKLKVTDNKPANIYANDATVVSGSSEDPLYAPVVQAKVVRRTVEGVAWVDSNRNGRRETTESKLADVNVSLYKSDGTQVLTDILGNNLTGVVTASDGSYSFTNLPSGNYYVQFDSSGTVDLSKYTLTTKQASGVGSTVNSDADAVLDGSGNLLSAKITGITTPAITDMKVMDYKMSNLDMGVYAPYTVNKTSNPTGSYDGSDVPVIKEGQIVTYTIAIDSPTTSQSNLTMTDKLPDGMSLVSGSISYKLQGGAQVKVNDSAYNSSTHTITWPTLEVPKGKSEYTFKAIVDKVDWEDGETQRIYENVAIAKQPDIPDQPSNTVEHKTIRREADIKKAAALVNEDNTVQSENNGTASSPVYSELEQTIEYRLVIKNTGHDDAKSGDIVITDNLPLDTTYVASSMTYTFRDSSNTSSTFPSSTATATMSGPDSSGKMIWTLKGMSSGEEAYLTFRVKAPTTSDNPATLLVKELEKEFDNTAHLKDVQREETVYETTYTDVDGNTYKENESVYSEKEISKDSNTTYHVVKEPLLTITKTSDVPEGSYVSSGDEITYSITVKNVGKATAKEFDIKDAIPEYTTYVPGSISYSGDATTVTPNDTAIIDGLGELTWKAEGLAVDKSVSVTFTVKVDEMYETGEREILNQAYTRLPEDPWTPSEEVEHKQKVAYEIEKYSDPETGSYVDGNQEITYFIKVTNTGESTLDKALVKDAIPEYTTYVDGSIAYEGSADLIIPDDTNITDGLGELTWNIEGVPVGEDVILSFKVKVDEMHETGERTITNVAYVKAPEDPWEPSEEVEHKQKVAYEIEKYSDPETGSYVDGNQEITYFIKVTNTGESSLDKAQVKDAIPEFTTYVEDSITYSGDADVVAVDDTNVIDGLGDLTWDIENVPVGKEVILSFKVKVDEMDASGERSIKNVAYVKAPEDPWEPSEEVEHKQKVAYEIEKSSNPESGSNVDGGNEITYFIKVTNTGESSLDNLQVKDAIPEYTTYVEESITYEGSADLITPDNTAIKDGLGELTWDIENVPVGESVTLSFKVKVDEFNKEGERFIKNQAYAKAPEEEEWTPSNEVEHKQSLSYEILKSSNPEHNSNVNSGDIVTYFIQVDNTSTETLRNVVISDKVPTGTEYEVDSIYSTIEDTIMNMEGRQLTWEIPEIKPDDSVIVSFRVKVTNESGSIKNIAQVQVDDNDPKDTNEIIHNILTKKASTAVGHPSVATGDDTSINGLISLFGISSLAIILGLLRRKRRI
ncbi:DUF7927 domain-containing protein [Breznakia pachnodae]|uniref:Repeat protein (TIGR01451 family) n=1 Tax=Breznakia pachnodae TaxID=265178 RepID=A0ABU0E227_9FIRM|nr:SdrD B-like domain-containing protein [Breznakia pachnodae]MDQ0360773.1 putative repeat protein (TIGR01451 family) [Breznakia pachnodae]